MKVLRPAEIRHITGTVIVHAPLDYSTFDGDFGYEHQVTPKSSAMMWRADAVEYRT